jgi:hypothetical protein
VREGGQKILTDLARDRSLQIQDSEQLPNKLNPRKSTRLVIVKLGKTKDKRKVLKTIPAT